jgi:four helix bundle protein
MVDRKFCQEDCVRNFEKLDVGQRAIDFSDLAYEVTRSFPDGERFDLTDQMRRAAVSLSSTLADGTSHTSRVDYAGIIEIATRSAFEVVSQATIGLCQGYFSTLITDVSLMQQSNRGGYGAVCENGSKSDPFGQPSTID